MLTNTFCHIAGVGPKTEWRLWDAGVTCWESALRCDGAKHRPPFRPCWAGPVRESLEHYGGRRPDYFAERLPANQQWRLYADFRDSCAFVDIETTGLSPSAEITTIVLYDGRTVRPYVRGRNLEAFADDVRAYRLLVTYNGKCFDGPLIEAHFGIRLPAAHVDLRYVLGGLGVKGGLKGCEKHLGIGRGELDGVDGFAAVLLWQEYRRRGDGRALETLLAYNARDVLSLEPLMHYAFNAKVKQTPFADSHLLPPCSPPPVPFRADPEVVDRVRRACSGPWALPM